MSKPARVSLNKPHLSIRSRSWTSISVGCRTKTPVSDIEGVVSDVGEVYVRGIQGFKIVWLSSRNEAVKPMGPFSRKVHGV